MPATEIRSLAELFHQIIKRNLNSDAWSWLEKKVNLVKTEERSVQLNLSFSQLPRITGRNIVELKNNEAAEITLLVPDLEIDHWTIDRLCRVWLLMQLPAGDKETYLKKINGLFAVAEMNEQVALYTALPFYGYPEEWIAKCEEGVRSNIGTVLEAIMYHNPYPAKFLSIPSWNQLVLKAFFMEKEVSKIYGLYERVNPALSETLLDYVQERLAAHRTVAPEIYQLT
ncbi:MAG: EboA domain-containing protein [Candidatus Pedobacter colombiensis]|uniref:EboA domain-containing protein n=1 Tax=Candidatus Pedobacter colombiensis TaxID=3121371 RepID=A0AAJ5W8C9_9SPHI|nr:EboA domain-containing protein [Pedobacter sp.]WEK18914.1 MAG: EboA domain-containing protein [Pedobacter sp.]